MSGCWLTKAALSCLVSLLATTVASAQPLACNAPANDFHEPLANAFLIEDLSSSGIAWSRLFGCELNNFTGGSGNAACLTGTPSSSLPVETTLTSLPFALGCQSSVTLTFRLNMQRSSPEAALYLEISSDDGLSWSEVRSWQQEIGASYAAPGEDIVVDLSGFSFPGIYASRLRWRYAESASGGSTADWYAQIDDVALTCNASPLADISVQTFGSHGPVIEGAVHNLSVVARNAGPAGAQSFQLNAILPNGAQLISATATLGQIDIQGRDIFVNAGDLAVGAEMQLSLAAKLATAALGSGPQSLMLFTSSVQSNSCDLHLEDNAELFDVAVLRDFDKDGVPDIGDLCPSDRERIDPGIRGCSPKLPRTTRQVLKTLDSMLALLTKFESGIVKPKQILKFKNLSQNFSTLSRQASGSLVSTQSAPTIEKQLQQYRTMLARFAPRSSRSVLKTKKLAQKIRFQIIYG